jgi:hypothetical protein
MFRLSNRTRSPRRVPQLEVLEDRTVPASTVTFSNGVVLIQGDASGNKVTVTDTGLPASNSQNNVLVQCDGQSKAFKHVQTIQANLFGGKDEMTYQLVAPLQPGTRTVLADLGTGADQFIASLKGDVLPGATLNISVRGDPGSDDIGSPDSIIFTASGVAIGGTVNLDLDGDWGNDFIGVGYNGNLTGTLAINARGNAGKDVVWMGFAPQVPGAGTLSVHVNGGLGGDSINVSVTGAAPQHLDAVIAADPADTVSHTPNVQVL